MNASRTNKQARFFTRCAWLMSGTASLVAAAAAWGTVCYTTQLRNCCSAITGGPQKRMCSGQPCDDLIWTNSVFTQHITATSGNEGFGNNPVAPPPQCSWDIRYCDQNGQCQTAGLITIDCTNEKLTGSDQCVATP